MSARHLLAPAVLATTSSILSALLAPTATRAAVDGAVTPLEYSLTLATQTNATGFGDNQSELNQALGQMFSDGSFQLGLTGNLEANGNGLVIFLDTKAGGVIASTTAGGYGVFGSVGGAKTDDWGNDTNGDLDITPTPNGPSIVSPGFNPDLSIEINAGGGGPNYYINVIDMTLPNEPNPNRDIFLPDPLDNTRSGLFNGPAVTSSYIRDNGATNAGAVTFAFDNTNVLGVNGTGNPAGVGDPATALTGFESLFSTLFLNADPGETIKLLAFITNGGGDYLSNQFLPGLPDNTENLGGPGFPPGGTPLFDAEAGFASPLASLYITLAHPEWGNAGAGSWSVDANWLVARPDGVNTTAKFGGAITANATVHVDGEHIVGAVLFDNSSYSYTLGGAGTLTFDALSGKTTRINVIAGSHAIDVPMNWQKNMRISVAASGVLNLNGPVAAATGISLTKDGAGEARIGNVRTQSLSVHEGTLKVIAGGSANAAGGTSIVSALTIAPPAALDLTNNSMIIDYAGAVGTLVDDVRQHLQTGRLTSSSADATKGLGYGDNAILGKSSFAGQTVDADSLLIKYTYFGDTNLDGQVDITDLGNLATAWQTSGAWTSGDSDYSGFIDITDLGLLATNWQAGVGSPLGPSFGEALAAVGLGGVSVPEPGASAAVLMALSAGLRRRRSR